MGLLGSWLFFFFFFFCGKQLYKWLAICFHIAFFYHFLLFNFHETYTRHLSHKMNVACTISCPNIKCQGHTGCSKVFVMSPWWLHACLADSLHMWHKYNPWGDSVSCSIFRSKFKDHTGHLKSRSHGLLKVFVSCLVCGIGVGGAVRFLVVGTIGQRERPPRGQLWMEQCLTPLKYWPI